MIILDSPHKCFVCGKSFTRNSNLKKHLELHNQSEVSDSQRIMAKFSCDFCTKTFTRKEYLKSHISIHTQGAYVSCIDWSAIIMLILFLESEHKCFHCKKMFTRKAHLVIHTRIHTGGL